MHGLTFCTRDELQAYDPDSVARHGTAQHFSVLCTSPVNCSHLWRKCASHKIKVVLALRFMPHIIPSHAIIPQVIMAKVYIAIAQQHGDSKMAKELKARLKESIKSVGEATTDAELAPK